MTRYTIRICADGITSEPLLETNDHFEVSTFLARRLRGREISLKKPDGYIDGDAFWNEPARCFYTLTEKLPPVEDTPFMGFWRAVNEQLAEPAVMGEVRTRWQDFLGSGASPLDYADRVRDCASAIRQFRSQNLREPDLREPTETSIPANTGELQP